MKKIKILPSIIIFPTICSLFITFFYVNKEIVIYPKSKYSMINVYSDKTTDGNTKATFKEGVDNEITFDYTLQNKSLYPYTGVSINSYRYPLDIHGYDFLKLTMKSEKETFLTIILGVLTGEIATIYEAPFEDVVKIGEKKVLSIKIEGS